MIHASSPVACLQMDLEQISKASFSECSKFEELTISPNFCHIIDLYNMELSKPVKIAYNLNDECLNQINECLNSRLV